MTASVVWSAPQVVNLLRFVQPAAEDANVPCFLFTFHAYGTWLPDREEGFVLRHEGVLPPDAKLASDYRERMGQDVVFFDDAKQRALIDAAIESCEHQVCRLHYVATESTHVHVLVRWDHDRSWMTVRSGLKRSLTRALNAQFQKPTWLVKGASRRHVKDEEHFERLVHEYLPQHRGWKWSEERGLFR